MEKVPGWQDLHSSSANDGGGFNGGPFIEAGVRDVPSNPAKGELKMTVKRLGFGVMVAVLAMGVTNAQDDMKGW